MHKLAFHRNDLKSEIIEIRHNAICHIHELLLLLARQENKCPVMGFVINFKMHDEKNLDFR